MSTRENEILDRLTEIMRLRQMYQQQENDLRNQLTKADEARKNSLVRQIGDTKQKRDELVPEETRLQLEAKRLREARIIDEVHNRSRA